MRNDKGRKEFQKRYRDEEWNSLKNMEKFWKERGEKTIDQFAALIKRWPRSEEGKKEPSALLQERLENSPILVLTANQVEANMMVRLLSKESSKSEGITTITADSCKFQFGMIADIRVVHVQAKDMSSFTKHGSFSTIESILKRYRPQLVVSLGVAFGKDATKQNISDVLICKKLFQYDSSNKYSGGTIKFNGTPYETDSDLMCRWVDLLEYEEFPEEERSLGTEKFNWYCGTMLSGGSVVDDAEQKVKLLEAAESMGMEDVVGGEMEGSGVYLACISEKIPCIVIKGICDWGVNKNTWDDVLKDVKTPPDNKTVKNSIQALSFTNAFLTLKYLLGYDSTFISVDGGAMDLPNVPVARLLTVNAFEHIMMKISAVNFFPYGLIGGACIMLFVLFRLFPFELFPIEYDIADLYIITKIMFMILLVTLSAIGVLAVPAAVSSRYRLKAWVKERISVLLFGEVSLLLFIGNIYIKEIAPMLNKANTSASLFPLVYGALLCASGIIWAAAKHLHTKPENLNLTTAIIIFKNLSFEKCCCVIENISETTLYSVSIGWICKTQHSFVQIHKCGTVPSKSQLSVTYHDWKLNSQEEVHAEASGTFLPIVPDTLQVNYRMPNGDLGVHLITKDPRKKNRLQHMDSCSSYSEQVLLWKNGTYKQVAKRICYSCERNDPPQQ